ncbi:MAG: IS481-like element ISRm20 family transposase [Synoicihabitans sp.]
MGNSCAGLEVTLSKAWEQGHGLAPMPWNTKNVVQLRREFVALAKMRGMSFSALCQRFAISRKTGYKWMKRQAGGGPDALANQPPRLTRRRNQTSVAMEQQVLALREEQPTWGPRKLRRRLKNLGVTGLPSTSAIGRLLRREGCIESAVSAQHTAWQRFERATPNELWQMDFKGHFAMHQNRCHPLTVIDDCSRYLIGLRACADEQSFGVQQHLQSMFMLYGLPECILCDNGPPWSGNGQRYTALSVWLMQLGVRTIHGRAFHPQTQGKDERFHRTLKNDLLCRHDWVDLRQTQQRFDSFRQVYNHDRPHDALGLDCPADHYRPSSRSMPSVIPRADYDQTDIVRRVKSKGEITFRNRFFYIGSAFHRLDVALRPTANEGVYRVYYAAFPLGLIDCQTPTSRRKGSYHPMVPEPTEQNTKV